MKKLLLTILLLVSFVSMQGQENKRILVAYFSWGGNTEALAKEIQRQTYADAYQIQPLVPYTTDYQTLAYEISNKEKADNARPTLKDTLATLNDYDIIFVGCPVWWFDAPMVIHSFLECKSYDFSGKTIIPFCTYATASYETLNDIVNATPSSNHLEGLGIRGSSNYNQQTIHSWLSRIGIADIVAGINDVKQASHDEGKVYTLDGIKATTKPDARKGVYIVNGKKKVY